MSLGYLLRRILAQYRLRQAQAGAAYARTIRRDAEASVRYHEDRALRAAAELNQLDHRAQLARMG